VADPLVERIDQLAKSQEDRHCGVLPAGAGKFPVFPVITGIFSFCASGSPYGLGKNQADQIVTAKFP
jgi:hypothetical protein